VLADELDMTLHISPLMGMDPTYALRASEPGERLEATAAKSSDATLDLRRRGLSRRLMAGLLARYPAMSLQVVAKIYAQSARLKLKGPRYFPHPDGPRPKGFIAP
jgi:DUF1365 family protein